MTELETIQNMFQLAQVAFHMGGAEPSEFPQHPTTRIVLETPNNYRPITERTKGNIGYPGFFTGFGFDEHGKLLWVGAWE